MLMADDPLIGPFGRLLPRPAGWEPIRPPSKKPSSRMPFNEDAIFDRDDNPLRMSRNTGQINHGQKLPSMSHILNTPRQEDAEPVQKPHPHSSPNQLPDIRHHTYRPDTYRPEFLANRANSSNNAVHHAAQQAPAWRALNHRMATEGPHFSFSFSDTVPASGMPAIADRHMLPGESGRGLQSNGAYHAPQTKRVIREESVPGMGLCYIYDDGTHLPKSIDGSLVNPQWGLTKAGHPRKRLSQACTTCREKKIKCLPSADGGRCTHCQKFDRECRFEPFSRSGPQSPSAASSGSPAAMDISSTSVSAGRDSIDPKDVTAQLHLRPTSSSKSSVDHSYSLSPMSYEASASRDPPDTVKTHKRLKQSSPNLASKEDLSSNAPDLTRTHGDSPKTAFDQHPGVDRFSGATDPYEVDEKMTEYYLNEYLSRINTTIYCMFPRKPFMKWVRRCRDKSVWDKMLLYAMLAHGSIFATNQQKKVDGQRFSDIAHEACSKTWGVFNLQVVQTRLILALHNFSIGRSTHVSDLCGSALRAACGMRINTEDGATNIADDRQLTYNLTPSILVECRRRSFWCAYIMDRFNGFGLGHQPMLQNIDCPLRLPCNDRMYEDGNIPETPFLDSDSVGVYRSSHDGRSAVGMMAHLVRISSIWGDVLARAERRPYQYPVENGEVFETFYLDITRKLDAWEKGLDGHLKYKAENVERAQKEGQLGAFGAMHTLHHFTTMKVNRHVRYEYLTSSQITRNVNRAYHAACKTLDMMKTLVRHQRPKKGQASSFAVCNPFTGFAILSAVDILTATGSLADVLVPHSRSMVLLAGGIEVLEELAEYWDSARQQLKLVGQRHANLLCTVQSQSSAAGRGTTSAFFAKEPLERISGIEYDLIYALPRRQYLEALGHGDAIKDDDEVLEIREMGARLNMASLPRGSTFSRENEVNE